DSAAAFVAVNDGVDVSISPLDPGLHILTNADVDDRTCPRLARAHRLFERVVIDTLRAAALPSALRPILSNHETDDARADPTAALCVHTPTYGTRSSSLVALESSGAMHYWHASGPPCVASYVEAQLPSAAAH